MSPSWPSIAVLLAACLHAVVATCSYPGNIAGTVAVAETRKTTYNTDDLLLYQCDGKGNGFISRYCRSNRWTAPDRACGSVPLLDSGAIGGIGVAVATLLVTVTFIVYSKCGLKDKDDKTEGSAKNYAVNNSEVQKSTVTMTTSDPKDSSAPKSRATSARTQNANSAQSSRINVNLNDNNSKTHGNNEVMV